MTMKKVILNPKRDYSVVHHHPWVFSGAIRAVEGDPAPGETVAVGIHPQDVMSYDAKQ